MRVPLALVLAVLALALPRPALAGEPALAETGLAVRIFDWTASGRRLLARTEVPMSAGVGHLRLSQEVEDPTPLAEVELRFLKLPGKPTSVALGSPDERSPPPLTLEPGERSLRVEPAPEDGHLTLSASAAPERLAPPHPGTWELELEDPGS